MSELQHIAFVCPRFSDGQSAGGAETLMRQLAEHAAERGMRVTFLTTCATDHFTWQNSIAPGCRTKGALEVFYFPVDEDRDIGVFRRNQQSISRRQDLSLAQEREWIENSVNSRKLYEHLRTNGDEYDRIVAGPYLFGLTYFAALIHPERTLLVPCLHDEPFAYLKIMQELFARVSGCMFNSDPEAALARGLYDLPKKKCHIVGMGLDSFETNAADFADKHKISAPYILYSGRREELKGTPLLMDYMAAFRLRTAKDIKLVLTGSGPINPPSVLSPHLLDVGFVSEEEKHAAMAGALAFCHPSTNESFGIVLLESWLAGSPALVHSGSEVLRFQCEQSGGGLWFSNYPEFEEELMLLIENPELCQRLGHAGRNYVLTEYTWENVETRLFSALEQTS